MTAVASIYGMNVIVNTSTDVRHLLVALITMIAVSMATLVYARRQGWW